jgi:hypothetical protein
MAGPDTCLPPGRKGHDGAPLDVGAFVEVADAIVANGLRPGAVEIFLGMPLVRAFDAELEPLAREARQGEVGAQQLVAAKRGSGLELDAGPAIEEIVTESAAESDAGSDRLVAVAVLGKEAVARRDQAPQPAFFGGGDDLF